MSVHESSSSKPLPPMNPATVRDGGMYVGFYDKASEEEIRKKIAELNRITFAPADVVRHNEERAPGKPIATDKNVRTREELRIAVGKNLCQPKALANSTYYKNKTARMKKRKKR